MALHILWGVIFFLGRCEALPKEHVNIILSGIAWKPVAAKIIVFSLAFFFIFWKQHAKENKLKIFVQGYPDSVKMVGNIICCFFSIGLMENCLSE